MESAITTTNKGAAMPAIKLTKQNIDRIAGAKAIGASNAAAAAAGGIIPRTFYLWMNQGIADEKAGKDSLYLYFIQEIRAARAKIECVALKAIYGAMKKGDAKIALAYLSKQRPKQWGKKPIEEYHPENPNDEIAATDNEALDEQTMRERIFSALIGSKAGR